MAVIHSLVFCSSYKYIKSLLRLLDSLAAVALYKIDGNSFTSAHPGGASRHLDTSPNGEFTAATQDLKVTSFTSGAPPPQQ